MMWLTLLPFAAAAELTHPTLSEDPRRWALQATEPPESVAAGTSGPEKSRPYLMEVNVRGKYMVIPSDFFNLWYYDETADNGNHAARPAPRAYAVGVEYVVKNDTQNGVFYFEYIGNLTEPGYWDDREDPHDFTDGQYIILDRVAAVAIGADYYYELHATPWLSFMFGAGLGFGLPFGNYQKWTAEEGQTATERYEADLPPTEEIPIREVGIPVLPLLDVNAAVKFDINHRANIRLEGGVHTMLYGGASLGIIF